MQTKIYHHASLEVVSSAFQNRERSGSSSLWLRVKELYTKYASRSWKLVGSDESSCLKIKEPSANVVLLDYISSGKWKDIIDFDDHLDDISNFDLCETSVIWELLCCLWSL
ncbi:hypothetical protein K7X08_022783 [Anisodus acutangulus]|uniref:Uncharacterized protein n=1 Tax=Anisodus acutangulus TaxID=402998 RepID=A0A9Q1RH00_9SOLA|nr:hypothetical protein K7X08_022783 [Anisodus acutangulus]